jgi:hypothetical protein
MKVLSKPIKWNDYNFNEKLKWYANKDCEFKNMFADKYKMKYILQIMNLPDLHYSKLITHVRPFVNDTEFDLVIPFENLFNSNKNKITQSKLDNIMYNIDTIDEFWKILKDKYNIYKYENTKYCANYVIKINLGWNSMIFVVNDQIRKIVHKKKKYNNDIENFELWKNDVIKDYKKKIPLKIFAEEFIGSNVKVFEIFCIYGEPRLMSVYFETSVSYESNFLIQMANEEESFSIKLLENSFLTNNAKALTFNLDIKECEKICNYAKEFAKHFEFVRVDFYYHRNKVYFSECTFKPGALSKIKWGKIGDFLSSFWSRKPANNK